MNINKISLSTILIPLGSFAVALHLVILFFAPSWQSNLLAVILISIGLTTFPAGLIIWVVEKLGKNQSEISNQAKSIRSFGLWIGIAIILFSIWFAYSMMKGWSAG